MSGLSLWWRKTNQTYDMKIEIIRDTGKIDKNNEHVFEVVKTYDDIKNRKEAEKAVRA